MKHVQAGLSARDVRESSFATVEVMQASLCAGNPDKSSEEVP